MMNDSEILLEILDEIGVSHDILNDYTRVEFKDGKLIDLDLRELEIDNIPSSI
ncbi:MAG: hypothetical protein ACXAD7_14530 [Candidatus Kariarchaeaceae archaeon]|jgi:hypothetical protein